MSVTAQSIIDRVRAQLIDDGAQYRWSDTELLRWLSDGQRTIVRMDPVASSTTATITLASGTRQTVPSGGERVLELYRNTSGQAINAVDPKILNVQNPSWPTTTAAAAVTHYFVDEADPRVFWVYPPNTGAGSIQMSYAVSPGELTALSDTLSLRDIFRTPLFDYVMFRAHEKDSDYAAGQALATLYMQAFTGFVGGARAA